MKLKNKQTGEIIDKWPDDFVVNSGSQIYNYNSLAELNEEWEDYKEQKEHWMINAFGDVETVSGIYTDDMIDELREIGNYFETKEEAELAVEKLKAETRLKNKGFKFNGCDDYHIDYKLTGLCAFTDETEKDLDLLFSGSEE